MDAATNGQTWAAWLSERVAVRGADGKMSQADLERALNDGGHPVTQSTVSRWLKGSRVKDSKMAAAVGEILGDRSGALLAAGYPLAALGPTAHISDGRRTREILIIGETEEDLLPYRDRSLTEILAMPHIRIELPSE
jgi:transcriptional regulator with XRE-family HTH domain